MPDQSEIDERVDPPDREPLVIKFVPEVSLETIQPSSVSKIPSLSSSKSVSSGIPSPSVSVKHPATPDSKWSAVPELSVSAGVCSHRFHLQFHLFHNLSHPLRHHY